MKKIALLLSLLLLTLNFNSAFAEEEEAKPVVDEEEYYISLNPHFTTNLMGTSGTHLMQLKAQVMVIGAKTKELVKLHMPAIRHELIMYFMTLSYNKLSTYQEKKMLADEATKIIQNVVTKYDDKARVEAFYIMSLVVQ